MMVLKIYPEAVIWRCSVEKVLLETSQNSKKNNFASLFFLQSWGLQLYTFFTKYLQWLSLTVFSFPEINIFVHFLY